MAAPHCRPSAPRLAPSLTQVRSSRIFKRWETRLEVNYNVLSTTQSLAGVAVMAHWMACLWSPPQQIQPPPGDPAAPTRSSFSRARS